ncbi:MAG TPA: hypothetical protein VK753_03915 [Xanthomonadaceae bacterium]|nr:hypothetical protein [Xanthomonadaceae bacterium]
MNPRTLLLLLLVAFAILTTSGCSTTLVESLPIGKTTRCDAAWPGRWHAVEHGVGKAAMSERIDINADCTQLTFTDPEKTQTEAHTLTLFSTRAGDFLTFGSPGDKPDCFGDGNTHCGTELFRYVRTGNVIQIYKPDHRAVHASLESHVVSGYTEMSLDPQTTATNGTQTGQPAVAAGLIQARAAAADDKQQPTYHNLIAGSSEQITRILVDHPEFFENDAYLILQREGPMNAGAHP